MTPIKIKNCGMKTQTAIDAAANSGADYLGFIHYPPSSRYIAAEDAAALSKPPSLKAVAVLVDPSDDEVQKILSLGYADMLQLHGDERPERVFAIKEISGLPVIKALGIASDLDVAEIKLFEAVADYLLLDTKSSEYGGTGKPFDWSLLSCTNFSKPWFLSGGLNIGNIAEALAQTHAPMIDVSSGIERTKGVKDVAMIEAFNARVRKLSAHSA